MSTKVAGVKAKGGAPGNRWGTYYPWEEWFEKRQFTLISGKDFHCTLPGMTLNVRVAARNRGIRVRIDQHPDRLVVTVKD
jgi:hypothetical protein